MSTRSPALISSIWFTAIRRRVKFSFMGECNSFPNWRTNARNVFFRMAHGLKFTLSTLLIKANGSRSFRYKVVSIQSRFDTNRSKFVTNVKSIRYKLTSLQIVSIQNTILERTQTSVVNETNPYLREPPNVPKRPTQWEHVNETKFWFGLFIENRDLYKWFWDFFYNSSEYYA